MLAGDPVTGARAPQRISRTYVRRVPAVLDLTLGEEVLTCTAAHPFWIPDVGWKEAGALSTGTVLLTRRGGTIVVGKVSERTGDFTVFNVEVEGFQTFFVGAAEVLVHNKAWELLPGLRPAQERLATVRDRIIRSQRNDRRAAARQQLLDRAQQVEAQLAELTRRMNAANTLAEVNAMTRDLGRTWHELAVIDRLSAEPVPLPTPQEQAQLDQYVQNLNAWRNAQAGGVNQAASDAAANAMAEIEALAVQNHGENNPLSRLWDHLESITGIRAGTQTMPIRHGPGRAYTEGLGRRFSTESTRFGSFRGMNFAEVEAAIGRPPNTVEGRFPERVRITWEFADGSYIHVDVPGTTNVSPYEINRLPHVARTAAQPNEGLHLSEAGIGVPFDSTPAHTTITKDARLTHLITRGLP